MKGIIFSDIDGTLFSDNREIDSKTSNKLILFKRLLNEIKKNFYFVLVTGRRYKSYLKIANTLNPHYAIIEHGSKILGTQSISSKWIDFLKSWIDNEGTLKGDLWIYKDVLIKEGFKIDSEGRIGSFRVFLDKPDNLPENLIPKLKKKLDSGAKKYGLSCIQNGKMLDIIPSLAGKANAAKFLTQGLSLSGLPTIALGNDYNDFDILNESDMQYIPRDSVPVIKDLVSSKGGYISNYSGIESSIDIFQNILKREIVVT